MASANGYDLLLAADSDEVDVVAHDLGQAGSVSAEAVVVDLSKPEGVESLFEAIGDRRIEILCANAGRGLNGALAGVDYADWRHVVETNIVGTTHLLQLASRKMAETGRGRILVTGSIAGLGPGPFEAVYSGTKAYLNSLAHALREELRSSGVSVTLLMPAATATRIFERGHYETTRLANGPLADAAEVARDGWNALLAGDAEVISAEHARTKAAEMKTKTPEQLAREHATIARPGSGDGMDRPSL